MKIAYYTEVDLDANDGPAVNELEFINSLQTLQAEQYTIFVPSLGKLHNTQNVVLLGKSPRISQLCQWHARYKLIANQLRAKQIDIVVCRLTDFPFIPFLIKLCNPKIKLAIKTAALWWAGRNPKQSAKDRFYNFLNDSLTKIVYKMSDAIDVAMPETHKRLEELKLAKSHKTIRIDNAINVELFTPRGTAEARKKLNIPLDAAVLGFAGSLPSQRGALQMLRVAEQLYPQVPNLYVLIVGHDAQLDELVRNCSLPRERIITPGIVSYLEVPFYLSAMTICYSFFEPHKIKTTGNASQKVKQYLSMGKPVISVATGHQYLADNMLGAPVKQDDISEIAQHTMHWLGKIAHEGEALVNRLHIYAVEHLSTIGTFKKRLEFWQKIVQD